MSETRKNPYNVQGISFESEHLLNDAKKRAKSFGISLSNYICQLVKNDLDDQSQIVRARPEGEKSPARHPFGLNEREKNAAEPPPEDPVSSKTKEEEVEATRKVLGIARRGPKKQP